MKKTILSICSGIGVLMALIGLLAGLSSINATGLGQIGVIFIFPSIAALFFVIMDFLITIGKIKKGLIYSVISSLIKIGIIALFIPNLIYDINYQQRFGFSNLEFDLLVMGGLAVIAIPSVINVFTLSSKNKNSKTTNNK